MKGQTVSTAGQQLKILSVGKVGNLLLHHGNAHPHVATVVQPYFSKRNIKINVHPLYSPNLVPCDFWLLLTLKEKLWEKVLYKKGKYIIVTVQYSSPETFMFYEKELKKMEI